MNITIYQSKFDWDETITQLGGQEYDGSTDPQPDVYYTLSSFVITHTDLLDEKRVTKITVQPLAKIKNRKSSYQQNVLHNFFSRQKQTEYHQFEPTLGGNVDTILLLKQETKSKESVYLIPFGQGFRKIESVTSKDFGINFAEREILETDVIKKQVNYFGQDKALAITNYRRASRNVALPSEAYSSITGHPKDVKRYGKTITCATGVSLLVSDSENKPFEDSLCQVIRDIDELMHSKEILSTFPRITYVNDSLKERELDTRLTSILKNQDNPNSMSVSVSNVSGEVKTVNFEEAVSLLLVSVIGNHIVFLDEMVKITLYINGDKRKTRASVDEIKEGDILEGDSKLLKGHLDKTIDNVRIDCEDQSGEVNSYDVTDFLSAEIAVDGKPYVMQNGEWGTFNAEFFELINASLADIEIAYSEEYSALKFQHHLGSKSKNGSEEDYMDALVGSKIDSFKKIHRHFAKPNSKSFSYNGPGVELADLYAENTGELLTMKLGERTSETLYSLDQSVLALSIINNRNAYDLEEIESYLGNAQKMKKALSVKRNVIVWVYPIKASDNKPRFAVNNTKQVQEHVFKLTNLGSILVKAKLSAWAQCVTEAHQKPVLRLVTPTDIAI